MRFFRSRSFLFLFDNRLSGTHKPYVTDAPVCARHIHSLVPHECAYTVQSSYPLFAILLTTGHLWLVCTSMRRGSLLPSTSTWHLLHAFRILFCTKSPTLALPFGGALEPTLEYPDGPCEWVPDYDTTVRCETHCTLPESRWNRVDSGYVFSQRTDDYE